MEAYGQIYLGIVLGMHQSRFGGFHKSCNKIWNLTWMRERMSTISKAIFIAIVKDIFISLEHSLPPPCDFVVCYFLNLILKIQVFCVVFLICTPIHFYSHLCIPRVPIMFGCFHIWHTFFIFLPISQENERQLQIHKPHMKMNYRAHACTQLFPLIHTKIQTL